MFGDKSIPSRSLRINAVTGQPERDRLVRIYDGISGLSSFSANLIGYSLVIFIAVWDQATGTRFGLSRFFSCRSHWSLGPGAEEVMNKVRENLLDAMKKNAWPATFSIGTVIYKDPPISVDELIKSADNIMYEVKNSGKNTIKFRLQEKPAI